MAEENIRPCEIGQVIEHTSQGTVQQIEDLRIYVSSPKNPNGKAILVFFDIWGFELPNTRAFVDGLALHGYTAILPDFFYGNPWTANKNKETDYKPWLASHPLERIEKDYIRVAEWINNKLNIKRIGTIGFCWGGRQVALSCSSGLFEAGVSFYGTWMIPEKHVVPICAPVLFLYGDKDAVCPMETILEIRKYAPQAKAKVEVRIFKDVGHGFAHKGNSEDYASAVEANKTMHSWFQTHMA
eukprot:TRINITY_DN10773_c0_g1_i1.p1 TRINITY_DN10773_c0_g1~~TRINITY_DN10773_c0_g1_i1.p1  ORF type:complete len:259 (+),score=44.26 TRINITY_DN10773_c0_g1_i1:55-777(+)